MTGFAYMYIIAVGGAQGGYLLTAKVFFTWAPRRLFTYCQTVFIGWILFSTTRVRKNGEEVFGPVICMSSRRGPLFVDGES